MRPAPHVIQLATTKVLFCFQILRVDIASPARAHLLEGRCWSVFWGGALSCTALSLGQLARKTQRRPQMACSQICSWLPKKSGQWDTRSSRRNCSAKGYGGYPLRKPNQSKQVHTQLCEPKCQLVSNSMFGTTGESSVQRPASWALFSRAEPNTCEST